MFFHAIFECELLIFLLSPPSSIAYFLALTHNNGIHSMHMISIQHVLLLLLLLFSYVPHQHWYGIPGAHITAETFAQFNLHKAAVISLLSRPFAQ